MGDGRVTAFDVIATIEESLDFVMPANWLGALCALPTLGGMVPPTELAQDLGHSADLLRNLDGAAERLEVVLGSTLLAVLQIAAKHKIDIGLALMEAIAAELEKQPAGGSHDPV